MTEVGDGEAAGLFQQLIGEEDELVLANRLKPYEDKVPQVLGALPAETAGAMLDRVSTQQAKRALFGNYTRIPDGRLHTLLATMQPERAARLVEGMAVGIDSPREMARVLAGLPGNALGAVIRATHPAAVVRLLEELEPQDQTRVVRSAGPDSASAIIEVLLAEENAVYAAWAAQLLRGLDPPSRATIRARLPDQRRQALTRWTGVVLATQALREVRASLEEAPVHAAAAALGQTYPPRAAQALRTMGAARAAVLLQHLAEDDPDLAADLLEAINTRILLRPPQPGKTPAWWLHECPAAGILEALELTPPAAQALLRAVRREQLELILQHVSAQRQAEISRCLEAPQVGSLPFSFEVMAVGRGQRKSHRVDGGLRWVHIEEELDTGEKVKPVVIDLLEVDLQRARLEARMAVDEATALPAARATEVFEAFRQTDRRPGADAFAHLGLVQLGRAVDATGALAAVNGSFYFDYGHYINGVTLGIDMTQVPGLFFGDPIGWFVSDGQELIPPAFNRAAGIVTGDGRFHIERIFMTDITLPNGRRVTWDDLNAPKTPGQVVAYNSLFGYQTEPADTHVDLAIARGRIWAITDGGGQVIPLTGFALSVPRERATAWLAGVSVGDRVTVGNNFPPSRGQVLQAMACGPHLVHDGALNLNFEEEDFGQQDSTVMSFFLPRWVETYEAARSFMAVRDNTLILGTVSGTAYGYGRPQVSGGMTFGELAQLCLDLNVDHAYALDGGGSSSLIARANGQVRVLNTPTGGADVGQGEERYINTYWLIFPR